MKPRSAAGMCKNLVEDHPHSGTRKPHGASIAADGTNVVWKGRCRKANVSVRPRPENWIRSGLTSKFSLDTKTEVPLLRMTA